MGTEYVEVADIVASEKDVFKIYKCGCSRKATLSDS